MIIASAIWAYAVTAFLALFVHLCQHKGGIQDGNQHLYMASVLVWQEFCLGPSTLIAVHVSFSSVFFWQLCILCILQHFILGQLL